MNQSRLNWCLILHIYNDDTDELNLTDEFVGRNSNRLNTWIIFVHFYLNGL